MKLKSGIVIAMAAVLLISIASIIALPRIEYRPSNAITFSDNYLALLMTDKTDEAYSLTEKNAIVGVTLEEFRDKVRRECVCHGVSREHKITLHYIFPRQTYGNRLRRLVYGRNPDMDRISIDYHVDGVPFEITVASRRNGKFAVVNFQAHAE